jgi:hypothetical protein
VRAAADNVNEAERRASIVLYGEWVFWILFCLRAQNPDVNVTWRSKRLDIAAILSAWKKAGFI